MLSADLVATVRYRNAPIDCPLLLQVSEPRRLAMTIGDGLWLQFIDLRAALAARSYARADSIVLEVADDLPGNAGRWRLDTGVAIPHSGGSADARYGSGRGGHPGVCRGAAAAGSRHASTPGGLSRQAPRKGLVPFGRAVARLKFPARTAARLADGLFATPRSPWLPGWLRGGGAATPRCGSGWERPRGWAAGGGDRIGGIKGPGGASGSDSLAPGKPVALVSFPLAPPG